MTLDELNGLTETDAVRELLRCCGSSAWALGMARKLPFRDLSDLSSTAGEIWWSLREEDWLGAFAAHPKIGGRGESAWSAQEQSGMSSVTRAASEEMAELNRAYELKFGWIFIICATGKDATEMLGQLRQRLGNDQVTELRITATEQAKITELRLGKLLAE